MFYTFLFHQEHLFNKVPEREKSTPQASVKWLTELSDSI